MRLTACLLTLTSPSAALAHTGHLSDFGGHDHWVAGAAIAISGGISLWLHLKGKRRADQEAQTEAEPEAEAVDDADDQHAGAPA